jgi:peptide-methionine (R)-S-oxide reductase
MRRLAGFATPALIAPCSSFSLLPQHTAMRMGNTKSSMASTSNKTTNCAQPNEADGSKDIGNEAWRKSLSPAEYRILRQKSTDPRHMPLDRFFEEGAYLCAGCKTLLYTSAMKFDCPCGWPAFYDCVPKAVREEPDADGSRVEILCNACNGHLGHVFRGEGFDNPPPNERHCVNSTSITFVAK